MSSPKVSFQESAGRIKVCGACLDSQTYLSLSQFLASEAGGAVAGNLDRYVGAEHEIARALEGGAYRVCIVDFDVNAREANRLIERMRALYPDICLFAVSGSADTEQIISAMRNGCADFLIKPIRPDTMSAALQRAEMRHRERSKNKKRGKVISLIGAKGGTGVTSIALHLSLSLAREHQKKCVLVDQHPALGDCSLYLGASRHKYSFYELAGSIERLDEELLEGFVLHHDSELDLLDSPDSVDYSAYATPAQIDQTISFLAETYQYVVVDCPPGLSDATLSTLSQSDQIAIVFTAELPAVRNAVRYKEYLSKLTMDPSNIYMVLNRYSRKASLAEDRVEKTLQHPIGLRIPNSYENVIRSINTGIPIETGRKSDFGTAINSWCREIMSEPAGEVAAAGKSSGHLLSFHNR